jgi:hypothetical protein
MKVWIVSYTHRHGTDLWPVNYEATEKDVIEGLDDWEPERGESIEVTGPFDVEPPQIDTQATEVSDDG